MFCNMASITLLWPFSHWHFFFYVFLILSLDICVILSYIPLARWCYYHLQYSSEFRKFWLKYIFSLTIFPICALHHFFLSCPFEYVFLRILTQDLYALNDFFSLFYKLAKDSKLIGTDFLLPFLLFHIVREIVLSGPSDSLKHYVSKVFSEYFYPNGLLLSDWALYLVFVKIKSEIVALLVIFLYLSRSPLLEIRKKWNLFQGVLANPDCFSISVTLIWAVHVNYPPI